MSSVAVDGGLRRSAVSVWLICSALALVPLCFARFPPSADLPQHLCQLRLFVEHLRHDDVTYAINWAWPNTLVYLLIAPAGLLLPVRWAPHGALATIALLHVGATWLLARRRGREPAAALLVLPLFFSHVFYWGFLNFAIGWPAFVVWFLVTTRPAWRDARQEALGTGAAALLLYGAHVLWLVAGLAWLVIHGVAHRIGVRRWLVRAIAVVPAVLLILAWYPRLQTSRLAEETALTWQVPPYARLLPANAVAMMFGGLHGPLEAGAAAAVALVIAVGLWTNRRRLAQFLDTDLIRAAALLLGAGLLLPDRTFDTIRLATRWVPYGVTLLVLGLPLPAWPGRRARVVMAAVAVTVYVGVTAAAWRRYERDSLAGLDAALSQVPEHSRVLGLDVVQTSAIVRNRPFIQLVAYAQWRHGGELNFSFAEHATGLVRYARPRVTPWTNGLEWFPERVLNTDLGHFDVVLVNGTSESLAGLDGESALEPVTTTSPWRLYRVRR